MPRFGRHKQVLAESAGIDRPTEDELRDPEFRAAWEDAELRDSMMLAFYHLRKERGWSQTELARRLGTTQSAVSEFEKQISEPRLPTLQRWARAFGYRLDVQLKAGPLPVYDSWVGRSLSYEKILGQIKVNNDLAVPWLTSDCCSTASSGQSIAVPADDVTVTAVHYRRPGEQAGYVGSLTTQLESVGAQ